MRSPSFVNSCSHYIEKRPIGVDNSTEWCYYFIKKGRIPSIIKKAMMKRVVVAGGRDYNHYEDAVAFIDYCIQNIRHRYTLVFVSGGCSGADALGERYANEHGFQIEIYPAEWKKYGRRAGPKRNQKMAEMGDYIICFWDGKSRGTYSMIYHAKKLGKPIKIKRYDEYTKNKKAQQMLWHTD